MIANTVIALVVVTLIALVAVAVLVDDAVTLVT